MNNYFCVFRLVGASNTKTSTFAAENGTEAISKMIMLANISSTMELDEAELLQIVDRGDDKDGKKTAYRPVFRKEKNAAKPKVTLDPPSQPAKEPEPSKVKAYVPPYEIEVL